MHEKGTRREVTQRKTSLRTSDRQGKNSPYSLLPNATCYPVGRRFAHNAMNTRNAVAPPYSLFSRQTRIGK